MKFINIVIATFACVLLADCGTHEVKHDPTHVLVGKGAEYYLPKTVLVATIPITKKERTPGRFHFFCLPLLGVEPEGHKITFGIGKPVTIESVGEPDKTQAYVSLYRKGPFQTFNQSYQWNNGILTHGEATVENKTVEFVVSTLEAAVKVAGAAAASEDREVQLRGLKQLLEYLEKLDPKSKGLTTEALQLALVSLSDPLVVDPGHSAKPGYTEWNAFLGRSMTNNTVVEDSHALREIIAAKKQAESLEALISSLPTVKDAVTMELKKKDITDTQALFLGAETDAIWPGQFRYAPPSRPDKKVEGSLENDVVLMRPDAATGVKFPVLKPEIMPSSDFTRTAPKKMEGLMDVVVGLAKKQVKTLTGDVTLAWASDVPDETKSWQMTLDTPGKRGWHYRVPAKSEASLFMGKDELEAKRLWIGQHGCVGFLPATSGGQTFVSNIDLDPVTGALKGATHGGKAFDPGLVNRVGTAAASIPR